MISQYCQILISLLLLPIFFQLCCDWSKFIFDFSIKKKKINLNGHEGGLHDKMIIKVLIPNIVLTCNLLIS